MGRAHYSFGKQSTEFWSGRGKNEKQAGAELGQAQVRLDDIVEVVIEVVVKAVVKVEV